MDSLEKALASHGLSDYIPLFNLHAIRTDVLTDLTTEHLLEIGVSSLGHRVRILKLIQEILISSHPSPEPTLTRPSYERALYSTPFLQTQFNSLAVSPSSPKSISSPKSPKIANSLAAAASRSQLHATPSGLSLRTNTPPILPESLMSVKSRSLSVPESKDFMANRPPSASTANSLAPSAANSLELTTQQTSFLKQRVEAHDHEIKRLYDSMHKMLRKLKENEPLPNPLDKLQDRHADHMHPKLATSPPAPTSASSVSHHPLGISPTPLTPGSHMMPLPSLPSAKHSPASLSRSNAATPSASTPGTAKFGDLKRGLNLEPGRSPLLDSKRSVADGYFTRSASLTHGNAPAPLASPSLGHAKPGPSNAASLPTAPTPGTPGTPSNGPYGHHAEPHASSNPNLMIQSDSQAEAFKKFRCAETDNAARVLGSMFRRYHLDGDLSHWRLQIMYGDRCRDLLNHEFPLVIFKQLQEQGHKPMFHAKKIQPPKPPPDSYI